MREWIAKKVCPYEEGVVQAKRLCAWGYDHGGMIGMRAERRALR